MGIFYHWLHQIAQLRPGTFVRPKKKWTLLGRKLVGKPQPAVHSTEFLFPKIINPTPLNFKFRALLLKFYLKFIPGFFFFKVTTPVPGKSKKAIKAAKAAKAAKALSFRTFKKAYRGLASLECAPLLNPEQQFVILQSQSARNLFRSRFLAIHFVSPYALLRASIRCEAPVSLTELLYVFSLKLSWFDGSTKLGRLTWVNTSYSHDFLVSLETSAPGDTFITESKKTWEAFTPEVTTRATPEARLLLAAQSAVAPKPVKPSELEATHAAFHRYTLSNAGINQGAVIPVRGFFNALYNKGRTPRNKQIYRTGVFWCLWLTVLTIVGPFYVFYGFTFIFTHLYLFPLAIIFRAAGVALARFYDVTAKQLWIRLISWL